MSAGDSLRLALGTLTVLPVPAPRAVDRSTARGAMVAAPVVGLGLGALAALTLAGLDRLGSGPLVPAVLTLGLLAWLTRGLHLDGLADVGDGLGSGRRLDAVLDVMRQPTVGALGATTLLFVVLVQVSALAEATSAGAGPASVLLAVMTGRVAIVFGCAAGVPAARSDGLGAAVAGTVPRVVVAAWVLLLLAVAAAAAFLSEALDGLGALWSVGVGLAVSLAVLVRCVRRLGGITGDVLGAGCEVATAATLVLADRLPGVCRGRRYDPLAGRTACAS